MMLRSRSSFTGARRGGVVAEFVTDFESATVGTGLPTGWTEITSTSGSWKIEDFSAERTLFRDQSINTRTLAGITEFASTADGEILVQFRTALTPSTGAVGGSSLRSFSSSGENVYYCGIRNAKFTIAKYVTGNFTLLDDTGGAASADTWYNIRFRAQGTALKGRFWVRGTSEPGTWTIETTDPSLSSGYPGAFVLLSTASQRFNFVSYREGSGTASSVGLPA